MLYAFCSISVICKIRFYFKLNLANTIFCDSITLRPIKIYLFYAPHTGAFCLHSGEMNAVAVGCKGYTPSCFTSRNSDKTCRETPLAKKHGFNHCLHSFACIFLPVAGHQSASLVKTKQLLQVFISSLLLFISPCIPDCSDHKESACNAGDQGFIPGWEDPLENGYSPSILV